MQDWVNLVYSWAVSGLCYILTLSQFNTGFKIFEGKIRAFSRIQLGSNHAQDSTDPFMLQRPDTKFPVHDASFLGCLGISICSPVSLSDYCTLIESSTSRGLVSNRWRALQALDQCSLKCFGGISVFPCLTSPLTLAGHCESEGLDCLQVMWLSFPTLSTASAGLACLGRTLSQPCAKVSSIMLVRTDILDFFLVLECILPCSGKDDINIV